MRLDPKLARMRVEEHRHRMLRAEKEAKIAQERRAKRLQLLECLKAKRTHARNSEYQALRHEMLEAAMGARDCLVVSRRVPAWLTAKLRKEGFDVSWSDEGLNRLGDQEARMLERRVPPVLGEYRRSAGELVDWLRRWSGKLEVEILEIVGDSLVAALDVLLELGPSDEDWGTRLALLSRWAEVNTKSPWSPAADVFSGVIEPSNLGFLGDIRLTQEHARQLARLAREARARAEAVVKCLPSELYPNPIRRGKVFLGYPVRLDIYWGTEDEYPLWDWDSPRPEEGALSRTFLSWLAHPDGQQFIGNLTQLINTAADSGHEQVLVDVDELSDWRICPPIDEIVDFLRSLKFRVSEQDEHLTVGWD